MTRWLLGTRRNAGGFSLLGFLVWAIILAFLGYLAVRVVPTVNELTTIQRAIDKIAADPAAATAPDIRNAFDRAREVEFAITSIKGKDLEITREGNRNVISFSYEKEIPLGGPAYLLLKYKGRSK